MSKRLSPTLDIKMYLPVNVEDVFTMVEDESDEEWTTENDEVL